jgi:SAM-dependent methyltransferase
MKDAALFHIDLLEAALEEDLILKDSSAYNIQWRGSKPIFIDIVSFEKLKSGEPWVGYRQFCEMFLNPLLLAAYKGVPFKHWMRGRIDGIEPSHLANLFTVSDLFRRGVLTHVYLHAKLQSLLKTSELSKSSFRKAGFSKEILTSNLKSLKRILRGLKPRSAKSHWANYSQTHSYGEPDYEIKKAFVKNVTDEGRWNLVWDLGCNTGDFSRIAAEKGAYVVAMDSDEEAVNALYERCKTEDEQRILPLGINLVDPSPSQGWRGQERQSLENRGRPNLVLALALLHHIVIGSNIPLPDFIEWLRSLDAVIVLEFISKEDEMVKVLLRNKDDLYSDYTEEVLENCLYSVFDLQRKIKLKNGLRTLYYVTPKVNNKIT